MNPIPVGIIGCGNIFANYVRHARLFDVLQLAACADLDMDRAASQAREHNLPKACTPAELLADDSIELVINLTVPTAHEEVSLAAIAAGKHVYSEKPMAVNRQGGRRIIAAAEAAGVRIGFAPDTFLGAGMQTSRKLIDDGQIGRPTFAICNVILPGHDHWHPNPQFFYQHGAGPVFDMGPYYITGLMQLFGRVARVTASGTITRPTRTLKAGPNAGSEIRIETPDHVSANLEFDCGVHATLIASFAGWHPELWPFTVFGVEGTLRVQDLNTFDEPIFLWKADNPKPFPRGEKWQTLPFTHRTGYGRAVGAADMATAIRTGRPHRASAEQGMAVLDVMASILEAVETGRAVQITSPYQRTAPLPVGLAEGQLDH